MIEFETFTEFVNKADDILKNFTLLMNFNALDLRIYKNYVYYQHSFSDIEKIDMLVKDKIWEWLMSYKYEKMDKNDLYSVLGQIKKGK